MGYPWYVRQQGLLFILLVYSDLLRLCVSEKANVCYEARAKCLLTIIRTEYILFVLQINHTMSMTM